MRAFSLQLNTMCASGKYTSVAQIGTKSSQAENFTRSAIAPLIRAVVITAKVSWNIMNV